MKCRSTIVAVILSVTRYSMITIQSLTVVSHEHSSDEYCDTEVFRAECSDGEMIVLERARYGRMKLGRCVELPMGSIGCFTDVLQMADRRCSGKRMCELRVPDAEFESTQPCLKELKTYMEASYTCVKVETVTTDYCKMADELNVTSASGFIASIVTSDTYLCDGVNHPWVINGFPGQKINLTLFDFASMPSSQMTSYDLLNRNRPETETSEVQIELCRTYGTIQDSGNDVTTTICGSKQRVSNLYYSEGNVLRLWVTGGVAPNDFKRFLIYYEVIGCGDPDLPDMMSFRRESDTRGIVGCKFTDVTWYVDCVHGQWTSTSSTICFLPTAEEAELNEATSQYETPDRPQFQPETVDKNENQFFEFAALLIVTVVGLVLIIILILVITRIASRRKGRENIASCPETVLLQPTSDESECKLEPIGSGKRARGRGRGGGGGDHRIQKDTPRRIQLPPANVANNFVDFYGQTESDYETIRRRSQ